MITEETDAGRPNGKRKKKEHEVVTRVLFAEDDDFIREIFAEHISKSLTGIDVQAFPDGRAALDFLQLHSDPFLLLTDICMPRVTGYDLLFTIFDRHLPITGCMIFSSLDKYDPMIKQTQALLTKQAIPYSIHEKFIQPADVVRIIKQLLEKIAEASVIPAAITGGLSKPA